MKQRMISVWLCIFLLVTLPFGSAQSPFAGGSGFDASQQSSAPVTSVPQYGSYSQGPYAGYTSGLESAFFQQDVTSPYVRWRESIYSTLFGSDMDAGESIMVYVSNYEPKVVRSSLLEKQDMPVFLQLEGSHLGSLASAFTGDAQQRDPLSGLDAVPPIKEVIITVNKSSPYVRGFNYIRPQRGEFSLHNLGGMIVFLARIRNESAFPENRTIPLDFTAKIVLDTADRLFGIAEQTLWLPQQSDEKSFLKPETDKTPNNIFNKRGYVRVTRIDDNSVTLVVYNKDLLPISLFSPAEAPAGVPVATVRLEKNQVSRPIRLGYTGNVFQDTVALRLDDIQTPRDRAKLIISVDGKNYEIRPVKDAPLFPNSKWQVKDIPKGEGTQVKAEDVKAQFPSLTDEQYDSLRKITGLTLTKQKVMIQHVQSGEKKILERTVLATPSGAALQVKPLTEGEADALERVYCPNIDDRAKVQFDYACQAIVRLKDVIVKHPTAQNVVQQAYEHLADIYNKKLIDWPACDVIKKGRSPVRNVQQCAVFQSDMQRLELFYYTKAGRTDAVNLVLREGTSFGNTEFLADDLVQIRLDGVMLESAKDKSEARLEIAGSLTDPVHAGDVITALGGKKDGQDFVWKVENIYGGSVRLRRYFMGAVAPGYLDTVTISTGEVAKVTVDEHTSQDARLQGIPPVPLSKDVKLVSTEVKNFAQITVVPAGGRSVVTSNFRVNIGLDERPFKLTPEQLQQKIKDTKELIAKLDTITKMMDSLVKTWKKACLITFGFVTAKNVLSGGGERALARKSVAQFYKQQCSEKVTKGEIGTLDECLAQNTAQMQKEIDANEKIIKSVDKQLEGKTPATLPACGAIKNFQELRKNVGVSADDCKDYLRLAAIKKEFGSNNNQKNEDYVRFMTGKLQTTSLEAKAADYNEAIKQVDTLKKASNYLGQYKDSEEQARLAVYQSIQQARFDQAKAVATTGITVLPSLRLDANDQEKAFAPIATVDQSGAVQNVENVQLVRLNQLQYRMFTEQLQAFVDERIAKSPQEKQNDPKFLVSLGNQLKKELSGPAQDDVGNILYVDPVYIEQNVDLTNTAILDKNKINANMNILGKVDLLARPDKPDNNKILIYTKTNNPSGMIKVYGSSAVTDQNRNIHSKSYANNKVTAQFSKTDGQAVCYPTGSNGEYILVNERYATNRVKDFEVWNVGANGVIECGSGDDDRVYTNKEINLPANKAQLERYEKVINDAPRCTADGQLVVEGKGTQDVSVKCSFQKEALTNALLQPKCIDVMEPEDCKLLFNACDPVMCPPSRCNLGGRYQVQDVIQTGIVGGALLCLPNYKQGIVVPVCLTGIEAGLKAMKSLLEGYQGCLEIKLKKGENVGFCDYARSVGTCELMWRQLITLFDLKGGIIDWVSGRVGDPQGGLEYFTFSENLKNVGNSFNYFTSEYSTTALAYYKGKSNEFGSQVCQLAVNGKVPAVGDILDKLSEPENPPQFDAVFDEAPYIESAGVPIAIQTVTAGAKEYSLYRVFYNIYAGTGYANEQGVLSNANLPAQNRPVTYAVYMDNPELGLPRLYVVDPERVGVQESRLELGTSTQVTVQRVAPKGYTRICVIINGHSPECGFGKASSAFAVNYINDQVVLSQANKKDIKTADECTPNPDSQASALGLAGIGVGNALGSATIGGGVPGLVTSFTNTGIVRVCNPYPPTAETTRWVKVGTCGDDESGKSLGSCWLDQSSIRVKDAQAALKDAVKGLQTPVAPGQELIPKTDGNIILKELNQLRDKILQQLKDVKKEVNPAPGSQANTNRAGQQPILSITHLENEIPAENKRAGVRDMNTVDKIVIHHTGLNLADTITHFSDKTKQVSSHYIIDTNGKVYQMVADNVVAYHVSGYNTNSIGIELVNDGHKKSVYTVKQYDALKELLRVIIANNRNIQLDNAHIVGHYELAKQTTDNTRKWDPSPNFDWERIGLENHLKLKDIIPNKADCKAQINFAGTGYTCEDIY